MAPSVQVIYVNKTSCMENQGTSVIRLTAFVSFSIIHAAEKYHGEMLSLEEHTSWKRSLMQSRHDLVLDIDQAHCLHISKHNNSKIINTRVMVTTFCRLLMLVNICMKFHEVVLNIITNYRAITTASQNLLILIPFIKYLTSVHLYIRTDGRTDERKDKRTDDLGENNMSPNPRRGGIIHQFGF